MSENGQDGIIKEQEDKPQEFLMRDYIPDEDEESLLSLYDELSATDNGQQALKFLFDGPVSKKDYANLIARQPRRITIVATPEGKIIGVGKYLVDVLEDPERATFSILIAPKYQGKGIGTKLIGHIIEKCREVDPGVIRLESFTRPDNKAAIDSLTKAQIKYGGTRDTEHLSPVHFTFPVR